MPSGNFLDISVDEQEFHEALKSVEDMHDSIDPRWLKNTQRRYASDIVSAMKRNSKSVSLQPMIGVTTAKKRAGKLGIKVGVVKNDPQEFEDFSAQALASVIEYGTAERYRTLKSAGLITGRVSTGAMPAAPFLRPAWDNNVADFMKGVEGAIIRKIERAA
jgi:hypothetical protein